MRTVNPKKLSRRQSEVIRQLYYRGKAGAWASFLAPSHSGNVLERLVSAGLVEIREEGPKKSARAFLTADGYAAYSHWRSH